MEERIYWLGFSSFPGIGPARFAKLLKHFGTGKDAWHAQVSDLIASGIGENIATEFNTFREEFSLFAYEKKLVENNVHYVTLKDSDYPELLGKMKNPPFLLYRKGTLDFDSLKNEKLLAVVGTRKVTDYGRQVTESLVEELARAGCIIVSGLALGVDAIAHKATLDARGKTIAVLGCGVDCCYPRENSILYSQILKNNGMIVSEYALGVQPNKGSFPSRNRIIAGLSLGVLVTEGAEDSGSLITARDALSNNRKVFAVPGPITSSVSRGPIALISKGAKIVTSAKDIIDELGIRNPESGVGNKKNNLKGDTKEEQKIIDVLQNESLHFDEIVKRTGFNSAQVGTLLSLMEMKGLVLQSSSGLFVLEG